MNLTKRIKYFSDNSYALALFRKVIVILGSVLSTAILSRYLGPELKGQYSTCLTWLHILVLLFQFGIFKLYPNYKREGNDSRIGDFFVTICSLKFFLFLLIGIILTFYLNLVANNKVVFFLIFMVIFNVYQSELIFIILIDNMRKQNLITMLVTFINVAALVCVYAATDRNLYLALGIYIAKDLLTIVCCLFSSNYRFYLPPNYRFLLYRMISIIIYPVLAALLLDLNYRLDVLFLGKMTNYYSVGLYSAGISLAEIAWLIPDVFKDILFNKTAKNDSVESIKFSLRFSNTIIIFMAIFIILLGEVVIRIFYGASYEASYLVTVVIFFGIPSMSVFKILNPLFQALGEWKFYTGVLASGVIANAILNYEGIKILGIYGAAISSIVSYTICGMVLLRKFMKNYNIAIREVLLINRSDINKILSFLTLIIKG